MGSGKMTLLITVAKLYDWRW